MTVTSGSAMAERPRELDQRFSGVGQFEAKFQIGGLRFAQLRHYAIYVYLPNYPNVYFSDCTFVA